MADDPLRETLEEIAPSLQPEVGQLISDHLAGSSIDEAWQALVQEILDEA